MKAVLKCTMIVLLLLSGSTSYAGINEANNAFNNGQYTNAYKAYRKLADQGNADAQYRLGQMYYDGKGLPQNFSKAVIWLQQAAENGHVPVQ